MSKRPTRNPYWFEFHLVLIHVNTSKELTEHRTEIFNQNEIWYRFEFILSLIWTRSLKKIPDGILICFILLNFFHFCFIVVSKICTATFGVVYAPYKFKTILKRIKTHYWITYFAYFMIMLFWYWNHIQRTSVLQCS